MGIIESGGVLYTASNDFTARAWDVNTGDEITVFRGHESSRGRSCYSVAHLLLRRTLMLAAERVCAN